MINFNNHRNNAEMSFIEMLSVFQPYLFMIMLVGVLSSMTGYLGTKYFIKPLYESSAILIINNRIDEENNSITNDDITSARNLATVYGIIVKSDAIMGPVIERMGSQLSTTELAQSVTVAAVNNTQVIQLSVRNHNPELALMYANEIVTVAPAIIVDMVEAGSVRVVSNPTLPTIPVSPNTFLNVCVSFFIGVMLGGGIVLIRHVLDQTFSSVEEIESYLGVTVIGIIPNADCLRSNTK